MPRHPSKNIEAKRRKILSVDNDMQFKNRKLFLSGRHKLYGPYELYGP